MCVVHFSLWTYIRRSLSLSLCLALYQKSQTDSLSHNSYLTAQIVNRKLITINLVTQRQQPIGCVYYCICVRHLSAANTVAATSTHWVPVWLLACDWLHRGRERDWSILVYCAIIESSFFSYISVYSRVAFGSWSWHKHGWYNINLKIRLLYIRSF